jgi:hypothetical protein
MFVKYLDWDIEVSRIASVEHRSVRVMDSSLFVHADSRSFAAPMECSQLSFEFFDA